MNRYFGEKEQNKIDDLLLILKLTGYTIELINDYSDSRIARITNTYLIDSTTNAVIKSIMIEIALNGNKELLYIDVDIILNTNSRIHHFFKSLDEFFEYFNNMVIDNKI